MHLLIDTQNLNTELNRDGLITSRVLLFNILVFYNYLQLEI